MGPKGVTAKAGVRAVTVATPEHQAWAAKERSRALTGLGAPAVRADREASLAMELRARADLPLTEAMAALVVLAERAAMVVLGARAAREARVVPVIPAVQPPTAPREAQAAGAARAARAAQSRATAAMAATVA